MAGSYNHIVDERGWFREDPGDFSDMIENLGDAHEACEQMYGMIWWLASRWSVAPNVHEASTADIVERARENYRDGLDVARLLTSEGAA